MHSKQVRSYGLFRGRVVDIGACNAETWFSLRFWRGGPTARAAAGRVDRDEVGCIAAVTEV